MTAPAARPGLARGLALALFVQVAACELWPALAPSGLAPPIAPAAPLAWAAFAHQAHRQDSWACMAPAWRHLAAGAPGPLYGEVFFDRELKFQYPPTSLLGFPLAAAAGLDEPGTRVAFSGLFWGAYLALAGGLAALLVAAARRYGSAPSAAERRLLAGGAVLATATCFPVAAALSYENVSLWIAALATCALGALVRGRPGRAGALIGLAALLKPHYALLLGWGLLRRQRRFAAGLAGALAAGLAASLAAGGLTAHLGYLDALRFLARHGETDVRNQGLAACLERLAGTPAAAWRMDVFHAPSAGVAAAAAAIAMGLLAAALLVPRRRGGGPLDLAIALLTVTLVSPIAWEHHLAIALPVAALAAAALAARPGPRAPLAAGLGLAYGVLAAGWAFAPEAPPAAANLFHAERLLPALGLLGIAYRLLPADGERGEDPVGPEHDERGVQVRDA